MRISKARVLSICFIIVAFLSSSFPVTAADKVLFTVATKSTYLYSAPSTSAARVYSVFQGQNFFVLARNADASWLRLNFAGATSEAWVQADLGKVAGDVNSLPVGEGSMTVPATVAAAPAQSASSAASSPSSSLPPLTNLKITITTNSTYVRSGPSRSTTPVASIFKGQTYSIRARSTDSVWVLILLPGGPGEAWITIGSGTINGEVNRIPVAGTQPVVSAAPAAPASQPTRPAALPRPAGVTPGSFELGGQVGGFNYPDLMKYAGMTWVKRQVRWAPGERADAGMIADAHAKGFKILLSVLGEPGHIAGGANYDDLARFVGDLARFGADGIEVWNEMNLDREWPRGEIDPVRYTDMLRRAYQQIKANNPGTLVISGAPAPTGAEGAFGADRVWNDDRYVRGMAAAGAANYMDCIGVHYNEGIISPTLSSGDPRANEYYTRYYSGMVLTYYNAFGRAKKLCFTELAYFSPEGFGPLPAGFAWASETSLAEHAQWLAEAVTLARSSPSVRMIIVFNVDLTTYGDDPQAAAAMVRPGGSCPACESLHAVTGGR